MTMIKKCICLQRQLDHFVTLFLDRIGPSGVRLTDFITLNYFDCTKRTLFQPNKIFCF